MRDKSKMDCRLSKEILEETVNSIAELNDITGINFAWRIAFYDSEVTINTKAIQSIIEYIKEITKTTTTEQKEGN